MNESHGAPRGASAGMPPPLAVRRRMGGRDPHEQHRASTPLELLFDLTVVVAVAAATARLHHGLTEGHIGEAAMAFAQTFFSIWWPWMSYTWFASAYDTDDVPFRMATMAQMIGVLLIAAGIQRSGHDDLAVVVGFLVMRLALVAQWWRASVEHPERRLTCRRYAAAISGLQLLWIARIAWVPDEWQFLAFSVLAALELAVPVWAARVGETPWHAHHVVERYGLFTIILLGECLVASAATITGLLDAHRWFPDLVVVVIAIGGLILGLWWAYFLVPFAQVLHHRRERGFLWGYGHALVFAALAVLGGALEVVADVLRSSVNHAAQPGQGHGHATPLFAMSLTAAAVITFFAALWWLGGQTTRRDARSPMYVLPVVLASTVAVVLVANGLALAWGLLLLATGPALMLGWVTRDRQSRPDRFAVR
jgi:low temperature requirement protein LtrA